MRTKIKQKSVIFLTFVLGIIIAIHVKSLNPSNTSVSLNSIREMENQMNLELIETDNISKLIQQRKVDLAKYESAYKEYGNVKSVIKSEFENSKIAAGFTRVIGTGIIIEIKDSDINLKQGVDPNNIVVHNIDIIMVINDLKIAGAEAISINGERVISLSEIKCSGATITIIGITYGQPFVINAIGNKQFLQAAILEPKSSANFLKVVYNINVNYKISDSVVVPEYYKKIEFKYLKEGE